MFNRALKMTLKRGLDKKSVKKKQREVVVILKQTGQDPKTPLVIFGLLNGSTGIRLLFTENLVLVIGFVKICPKNHLVPGFN